MNISCIVDVASREVSFQENYKIASYDHNVDVIHFSVEPIEDFSLNTSTIRIAAQGPNNVRHDYAVDPSTVAIEEETGYITFDWPIPQDVTEMPIGTFKYGDKGRLIFAVCAEIISGDTVSKAWHSDDGIITVVAHLEPESGGGEDPEEEATNAQKIAQLQTDVAVINTQVGALANGSPTPVETIAEMTDESAVYLYTGSETGYTAGNWYFWNGSAWTSGGQYGGAVTDTTLTIEGAAADAKAVGDAIGEVNESLDGIIKERTEVVSFDTTETGTAYNIDSTSGTAWSGANSYIKSVTEGDRYKITTTIIKNPKYYAVLLYNGTTFVSGVYQGNSDSTTPITDYEFKIPGGVNKIIVTCPATVTPILKETTKYFDIDVEPITKNYVSFDGTTLTVKARYNSSEDIVIQMKKRGNNNLFDFDKIFTVAKAEKLNGDFTQLRSILVSNTDCFSPHQVRAKENIDGDSTSYFLTGGNHNHENVPTAYCDNLRVFVDEAETVNFNGACNSIRVMWESHIQGHNTWKANGTGRSILDEQIELRIEGSTIDVTIKQIPTETIYQSVFYGIQSINTPYSTVRFIGGSNRASIPINSANNNGSLDCRRTVATNPTTGDCLETKVLDEDLGTFSLTGSSYSAFTANNKLYYAVMKDQTVTMNQGDLYCLFGQYRFYSDAD